jgi:L-fuculose-phosphate aldolase
MMLLQEIREEIIEYGKKAIESRLTKGTGGNLSICDRESGLMAITPSGIDYFEITPEQIVIIDVQTGKIVDGTAVPSSECDMHRIFYKYRTDINAIIHTHTTFAATLSCLNWSLPAVHYLVAYAGTDVRCAKYATYGTIPLAKNAFEAMKDRNAVLLANHGLLAGGANLGHAFAITEEIEFCCELYYRTKCIGEPVILPQDEMERMIERFKNYGKRIEEHETI